MALEGQSFIVTGGATGIGAGTARFLIERGAFVTICGRRADRIDTAVAELGPLCRGVQADITVKEDRDDLVAAALEHGGALHGLINNAGNMYRGALDSLDEQSLLALFHNNVVAATMLSARCQAYLEATRGSIVFIGSIHTRRAFPGVAPYAATKGAIEALTQSLAAELGTRGIRVNCVVPGAVFTEINQRAGLFTDEQARQRLEGMKELHALGRIGEAHEVAEAIGYLLGAAWTTGAILHVDGGLALGTTRG